MSGSRRRQTLALVLLVLLLGSVGAVVVLGTQRIGHDATWLLAQARSAGPVGWIVAALVQTLVASSGIMPASVTGLATGAIYGVAAGFVLAASGTLLGGTLAFLLSRSLLRPWVARWIGRRSWLARLDRIVGEDGWRVVCLLRLSPLMPFAVTSYALGLTSLGLRGYLLGTLASLPALLGYVVLGHLTGAGFSDAAQGASLLRWATLGIGLLATALLTLRIGWLARRIALSGTALSFAAGLDQE